MTTDTWDETPPVRPRTLRRNRSIPGTYATSDRRYEIHLTTDGWEVYDRTRRPEDGLHQPVSIHRTFQEARSTVSTPLDRMPWIIGDPDDGILRAEPGLRPAIDWARGWAAARNTGRYVYAEHVYEYVFGDQDDSTSVFIIRADLAHTRGWDAEQRPLYPYLAPHQYETRDRTEAP